MTPSFLLISGISLCVLILASVVTFIGVKIKPQSDTFKKVKTIVTTWWPIVASLLIMLASAPNGILLGFLLLSLLGIFEYFKHSRLHKLKSIMVILLSCFVILQFGLLYFKKIDLFQSLPLFFILFTVPPVLLFSHSQQRLPEIFSSFIGVTLMTHFLACFPALFLWAQNHWGSLEKAQIFIFVIVFLTIGNDVFQFICGKLFGKRKIVPHLSPNKTEAGFIGGMIISGLLAAFFLTQFIGLSMGASFAIGVFISIYGMQGDLLFSLIKRYFGTKDFSNALPGHGGYLDRLDSLILIAPVVYYMSYFFEGVF